MASKTPELELPYPTPGDRANTGAQAVRDLAHAIERALANLNLDTI